MLEKLTLLRIVPLSLMFIWFFIICFQAFSWLKFGSVSIPKGWIIYCLSAILLLFFFDSNSGFSSVYLKYAYTLVAFILIFFNVALAFDWYSKFALLNRFEHILNGFVLAYVLFGYFSVQPYFIAINSPTIRILFIFGLVNTLGVLNELLELMLDTLFGEANIGPHLFDTNLDLFMNWIGFSLLLILQYLGFGYVDQ